MNIMLCDILQPSFQFTTPIINLVSFYCFTWAFKNTIIGLPDDATYSFVQNTLGVSVSHWLRLCNVLLV